MTERAVILSLSEKLYICSRLLTKAAERLGWDHSEVKELVAALRESVRMTTEQKCETCRFWLTSDDEDASFVGECRRMPPQLPATDEQQDESLSALGKEGVWRGWWPETSKSDWCGEYQSGPQRNNAESAPERSEEDTLEQFRRTPVE